jgi:thymidylate kinase
VLLAWDRLVLAVRVRRHAVAGRIVVCDRYPSAMVGAMDSARLCAPAQPDGRDRLLGLLAGLENRIYRRMPAPDLVIRLTVPVEVAIERNRERVKKGKESDAYVRHRHTAAIVPAFPAAKTIEVNSDQSQAQTIREVRRIVWEEF